MSSAVDDGTTFFSTSCKAPGALSYEFPYQFIRVRHLDTFIWIELFVQEICAEGHIRCRGKVEFRSEKDI